jgi:hypothetical protein
LFKDLVANGLIEKAPEITNLNFLSSKPEVGKNLLDNIFAQIFFIKDIKRIDIEFGPVSFKDFFKCNSIPIFHKVEKTGIG